MKSVRIVVLGIAAVCAVGAAVLVRMALTGKPTPQASAHAAIKTIPTARVLVARRDLKVGDRIIEADLDWRAMPLEQIRPDWTRDDTPPAGQPAAPAATPASGAPPAPPPPASSGAQGGTKQVGADGSVLSLNGAVQALQGGPKQPYVGAVVREAVAAGDPITPHKVVRAGESGYLAVVLSPGKRAMAIPVTVDAAAGGFVLPGDRVDVLLTRKLETGKPNSLIVSQTVLRNMKVLAVDQTTHTEKDAAAVVGATVTLEVGPEEAEALAASKAAGTLSLALRSYADQGSSSGRTNAPLLASFSGDVGGPAAGVKVYRNGEGRQEGMSHP